MATFKFGRQVNIHWNGFDVKGPADTVFSIPDQLYEEFESDIRGVEPSLTWIDTNEFQTLTNEVSTAALSATFPVAIATSTTGKTISLSSSTNPNGYLMVADGSGGVIFTPASTSGLTSVVGVSPISAIVSGGTVSVSLTANYQTAGSYQPAGTYVTGVVGTSPISASGTTSITVTIDQALITGATAAENAETLRHYVKNTTGTTIPLGSAVYISGATGDNALISLATASTEVGSSKTLGLTAESIANDAFGYVIEAGYLAGIDTTSTTAGASVWLGNTPGSLVFGSPPAEPSNSVYLGVVIREQLINGSLLVKVQNGYELDELHDVSAASPSDGDILQYKTSSTLWTKSSIAGAGIAASVHTHDYQASGTYVNAVIGTSPASVLTASGTSTVSIVNSSINSTHIAANAVVAGAIASNAVTSGNIAAAAVNTAKIDSTGGSSGWVLTSNGTGGASFASISSSVETIVQLTGTGTWVRPSNVKTIDIIILGAGGGGGGGGLAYKHGGTDSYARGGGGGSSGKWLLAYGIYVADQTSFSYSVGAGGAGGAARTYTKAAAVTGADQSLTGNAGSNGASTTFGNLITVTGSSAGTGGTVSLTASAPTTNTGGGASTYNPGTLSFGYPTASKGQSNGGDAGASPASGSTSNADWYFNGVLDTGNETYPERFGWLPSVIPVNAYVAITTSSATISTNFATDSQVAAIGASTDSTFNSGDGPVGGAGGGRATISSGTAGADAGSSTQSPSGPGGSGVAYYIGGSGRIITLTASNGGSGISGRAGGGGGGGGCTSAASSTANSTSASLTLSSGAGGNGSNALMYIRYVG